MKLNHLFAASSLALLLPVGGSVAAASYQGAGQVCGTVTDPEGAVIPNTILKARHAQSGGESSAVTDGQGRFCFRSLPPGGHSVTAGTPGFRTAARNVQVAAGARVEVDFSLEVASVSDSITIDN